MAPKSAEVLDELAVLRRVLGQLYDSLEDRAVIK